MIAIAKEPQRSNISDWQRRFLEMLPSIRRNARIAFRDLRGESREEAVDDVIANTLVAYRRLVEQQREELAYPTVLARFGVARVRAGRQVGMRLNCRDVLSGHAQQHHGFAVVRLDEVNDLTEEWREMAVEDRRNGCPADLAAFRIDFPAWLKSLSCRERRVANALAFGEPTGHVARLFGLSPARVSQLRQKLYEAWLRFHGECVPETAPAPAVA